LTDSGTLQGAVLKTLLGLAAALSLAGCATTPPPVATVAPARVPVTGRIPPPVPVTLPSVARLQNVNVEIDHAWLAKVLRGEQHPDLLTRMRAGFELGDPVHERIDRELAWYGRHPEYLERTFTRAAPYWHHIVSEIESRGLPLELAVLPVIESAFEPYAYSRARAMGLWQFIPGTGTRYGLKQDFWYDGRRDVVSATRAALDYLTTLRDMFNGDWLLAIAAYNCGENCVARAVRRNEQLGLPTDYWSLKLPRETLGYVPRFLAMARLVNDPSALELELSPLPNEPYFEAVDTGGQIDLQVAAELAGVDIEEIYALNPAYHRFATDPAGPHFLLVPVESADTFRQNLLQLTPDQRMRVERYEVRRGDTVAAVANRFKTSPGMIRELNELSATDRLVVGSEMRVPSAVSTLPPKVVQAALRVDGRAAGGRTRAGLQVHVVRRGDSLYAISRKTGVPVRTLASLNGISTGSTLRMGQRLRLAGASNPADSAVAAPARAAAQPGTAAATDDPGRRVTYVVRRGDNLTAIARVLRVSVPELRNWNSLGNRNTLRPGQRLVAFIGNEGG
jgi:membrane-bound lytic murein transglycosylase D